MWCNQLFWYDTSSFLEQAAVWLCDIFSHGYQLFSKIPKNSVKNTNFFYLFLHIFLLKATQDNKNTKNRILPK